LYVGWPDGILCLFLQAVEIERIIPLAKVHTKYVCQSCGYVTPRWVGKCPNCTEWNSFVEELSTPARASRKTSLPSSLEPVSLEDVDRDAVPRVRSGIRELDRVLGGGLVPGSLLLLGGDPGIGKSTLMMQVALALKDRVVLYVTGEESISQIKLRAERLENVSGKHVLLLAETNLDLILDVLDRTPPDVLVIDVLYAIGLLPLFFGIFTVYRYVLKEKHKEVYFMMAFALAIALLLWLKMIQLETGLLFLGAVLVILASQSFKLFFSYFSVRYIPVNSKLGYGAIGVTQRQLNEIIGFIGIR